jgi:hypothetical protein
MSSKKQAMIGLVQMFLIDAESRRDATDQSDLSRTCVYNLV